MIGTIKIVCNFLVIAIEFVSISQIFSEYYTV